MIFVEVNRKPRESMLVYRFAILKILAIKCEQFNCRSIGRKIDVIVVLFHNPIPEFNSLVVVLRFLVVTNQMQAGSRMRRKYPIHKVPPEVLNMAL